MAPLSPPLLVSVESLPDENVVDYTLKFTNLKYVSSLSTPKCTLITNAHLRVCCGSGSYGCVVVTSIQTVYASLFVGRAARRELNCIELFRCAQTTESTSVSIRGQLIAFSTLTLHVTSRRAEVAGGADESSGSWGTTSQHLDCHTSTDHGPARGIGLEVLADGGNFTLALQGPSVSLYVPMALRTTNLPSVHAGRSVTPTEASYVQICL